VLDATGVSAVNGTLLADPQCFGDVTIARMASTACGLGACREPGAAVCLEGGGAAERAAG
jgi:hypothetical protein